MSMPRLRTICCEKCKKEFDVTVYESINVSLNPELKEKIMSGEIYVFECPFCHEKHYIRYPFLYNDMKGKFMIQQGSPTMLMDYDDKVVKGNGEGINKDFMGLLGDYKYLGATSFSDFRSKVIMLDNGLDYRIGTLYELISIAQFNYYLEENKDESIKTIDAFFNYNNEGKMCVTIEVEETKEPHDHKSLDVIFDKEMYDKIEKDFAQNVDDVYNFFFDHNNASKYLYADKDKIEAYKNTIIEMAVVELINGNEFMTFVPEFNEGKYKVDDMVIIMKDKAVAKGKIKAFYHMNRYALPEDLEYMPVVAWNVRDVELVSTKDSDARLFNFKLKNDLASHKEDSKFDDKQLAKTDVIATLEVALKKGLDINPEALKVGDTLPSDSLDMRFSGTFINDEEYLNVYLDQEDCKDNNVSKAIYNFETLVDVVLNRPERFSGIVINPGEEQIVLSSPRLVRHRQDLIMCDSVKMRHILKELKPNEINYLSKFYYEVICEAYFKDTSPKQIAEEMGKDIEEVKKAFGEGYWLLKHIIWDNYQFDDK